MRTSTFARSGVVLTVSALAFSLGTGPSSAAETGTAAAATESAAPAASVEALTAGPTGTAAVPATGIRFGSSTITSRGATLFVGTGQFAGDGGANAVVRVNGRYKGTTAVLFSKTTPGTIAVNIPRGWGAGKVQLDVAGVVSNTFYARRQTKTTRGDGFALSIKRRNSKVTFSARQVKRINPSNGKYVSAKRVKLQAQRGGSWRTVKTIKLNSRGNGSVKKTLTKKYRYRLYIPRSSTVEQFSTRQTGKI